FLTWLKNNNYDVEEVRKYDQKELKKVIEKSPYHKATSGDIDWVSKVKMQGAVQKWVDHSISVTVNLPKEVTEELVSEVYETAWRSGCKGMTIYRDGSRSGVLVNKEEGKKEDEVKFKETHAPKRPKIIKAEVVRFQNDYEKWVAVVGLIDNRPYEVFTGRADDFYLPQWVEKGEVIKQRLDDGSSRYDFKFKDKQDYNITVEGLSRSFNKEFWNYAKLISGVLRHGMPIKHAIHLIDNLNFDVESINTWKNGVVRALKKYIPDGEKETGTVCPSCKKENTMQYTEGCLKCSSCGYSKC
ncbi:MAG TPA: hypothetical protein VJ939_06115, partial [Bacteroidales bacterium]|nr:hypothetical protein [Bacteroidales bacterium]